MTERQSHEPKLRALAAYRERRLGVNARQRLERHLVGCDRCRATLAGMERYQSLIEAVLETDPPEIEWARMDLVLQREAAHALRRRRVRQFVALGVLATAASIALFVTQTRAPMVPSSAANTSKVIEAHSASLHVDVTAIVGAVDGVDTNGSHIAVGLGTSPSEGWVLETGPHSELHIALEGTAAVLVPANSSLILRSLREGRVVLELTRGSVVNHVRKLVPDEGYEVIADAHRVSVRGTRFSVERLAPGLAVQVDEGAVAVLGKDGQLITELRAPYRWTEGLRSLASAPEAHVRDLPKPREFAAGSANWPALEVPTWPHVVNWGIDGASLGSEAELRMRVPLGSLEILALLDDGRRMTATLQVDAVGAKFDPRALRWLGTKPAMERSAEPPNIDPKNAATVIHADGVALQRCYERALRGQPDVSSGAIRMRLRLDLDAEGRVKRVALAALNQERVPSLLNDCVRQVAQRWRFDAPGGRGVTFEAPLSFRAAH